MRFRSLRVAWLVLAAVLLQLTGCSSLRGPATVSDIAVIPGARTALYVKFRPDLRHEHGSVWLMPTWGYVHGVKWDTEGLTRSELLCDIVTSGRRLFPEFFISDNGSAYCFSALPLSARQQKRLHCIWEFSPDLMTCRKLVPSRPQDLFLCFDSFNLLGDSFPAMIIALHKDLREQEEGPNIVVSASTGEWRGLPYRMRADRCLLLPTGSVIWVPEDLSRNAVPSCRALCVDNDVLEENVERLWGITPDGSRVFFSQMVADGGSTTSTLFAYDTESRSVSELTNWVGQKFKAGQACDRFGFLDAYKGEPREGLPARNVVVRGARVFSADGTLLRRVHIEPPINAGTCDWDVDLMQIVYYDSESDRIVVQEIGGDVITSFRP